MQRCAARKHIKVHPRLIMLSLWQRHVLFLFLGVGGPRCPNRQCVSTERENDGRETVFAAIDSLSMSLPRTRAEQKGAPVRERHTTAGTCSTTSPSLRRPSSEPWLHAHGITVTHHSAGNTKTSSWQRSEKAPTHTSRSRPNVKMKIAMMTVWEPLFLHGLPTHKSFFVDLSTADVRLRLGPGYSQRLHQRQLRADSEG